MTEVLCADTLAHADAGARVARHVADTRGALACPACGAGLERTVVGQSRVEIDYCRAHGTWFDKDELGRVAQWYATARAYGRHGSGAVAGAAVAGAAVAGTAVAGAALMASEQHEVQRFAQNIDAEDVADLAIEGGSAAFDVGCAVGDAVDVGEVAGGVFELLGGIFEAFG